MTPKIRIGLEILGVAALAAFGFSAWLEQHDARIALKASTAQIESQRAKAKEETATQVKSIEQEKAAIKTPDQAIQIVNKYIPLPIPLHIELPVAQTPGSLQEKPNAPIPQQIVLAPEDVIPLAKYSEDCRECQVKLIGANADNEQLKKELGQTQDALRGGTFFQRIKRNAKWLIIGAAAGAIAAKAH
jgi:hypothetical protein